MKPFIHEQEQWPYFYWQQERLAEQLGEVRRRQGQLIGRMEGLGFQVCAEAVLQSLTEETIKSSEIEGESLDRAQVRSSLARRLGMDVGGLVPSNRSVEGVVEMMLDATQRFAVPLTTQRLFQWHAALFPTGRSGMVKIRVGKWRDDHRGPMQVVSGSFGKEKVHFQAPDAHRLKREMRLFLSWLNGKTALDAVVKAGVAHLWFVTLHPFEDGNGRIARAIADLQLARSEGSSQRFYSLSAQVSLERNAYYNILEATQRGGLDITAWLEWFLGCLGRAFGGAEILLEVVLRKARFWAAHREEQFNVRQRQLINRLLDGFEGKLTSSKWAALGKCSQDTASRDIDDLVRRNILVKNPAGGRSTSYTLCN